MNFIFLKKFLKSCFFQLLKKSLKKIKPKGVGIGSPKFSYKKTVGGFKEEMKQGPKSVGTGKAKFEYKKGGGNAENLNL